jgi:hypothetical protein
MELYLLVAGVVNIRFSEKLKLHAAEAGGIF